MKKQKMELPPTTTGNPENKNMYLVRANYSTNGLIIQYLEDGLRHAQIHRTEYRNPR